MGTIFDSKKSIFKKSKALMTDGCCEVPEPCCGIGAALKGGYKVYFDDGTIPVEMTDGLSFYKALPSGTKWSVYLETTGPVGVVTSSIYVTPTPPVYLSVGSPITTPYPGSSAILSSSISLGPVNVTVTLTTDSGNITFSVNITSL
jgi:hypothetical protein